MTVRLYYNAADSRAKGGLTLNGTVSHVKNFLPDKS